jgi:hypothetical protein
MAGAAATAAAWFFLFIPSILLAQIDTAWVRRYDGPRHGEDWATCIAVDSSGNVYVAGSSARDTGYVNLDFITIKYYPNGDTAWVRRRDFGGDDQPTGLLVDTQGNTYVTGYGNGRVVTVKYSPTGQVLWSLPYGPQDEVGVGGIALDANGNVLLCGGVLNGLYFDALVIKYRPNGDTAWVRTYDVTEHDNAAHAIAVDQDGSLYMVGSCVDSIPRQQCLALKCDSVGNLLWAASPFRSAEREWLDGIVLDNAGDVVAVGKSIGPTGYDYLTMKYDSQGDTLWTRRYNGTADDWDEARAVAVDSAGNAYVTGYADYADTDHDFTTIKYRPDGSVAWLARYDGPAHSGDGAYALAVDRSGRVYVTGNSYNGSGTLADCATVCYDSGGDTLWVRRYNSPQNWAEYTTALALGPSGVVCVAGIGYTIGDASDFLTIKYAERSAIAEVSVPRVRATSMVVAPNPCVERTVVHYSIGVAGRVRLVVLDALGRQVCVLDDGVRVAGPHSVAWNRVDADGRRVPAGVYVVETESGGSSVRTKVLVMD